MHILDIISRNKLVHFLVLTFNFLYNKTGYSILYKTIKMTKVDFYIDFLETQVSELHPRSVKRVLKVKLRGKNFHNTQHIKLQKKVNIF